MDSAGVWLVFIFAGLYFLFGLRILGPDENGVKVFLGKPWKAAYSGLIFIWWPLERVVRITKTRLELDFEIEQIVTRVGLYYVTEETKDEQGNIKTEIKETRKAEPARIALNAGLYVSFGEEEENLLQVVQYLPLEILTAKNIKEALTDFLDQLVTSAIRSVAAGKTWFEVNNKRDEVAKEAAEKLRVAGGTFDLAGLGDRFEIVITDVKLPEELQKALTGVEIAERKKEETKINAEAERIKTETLAEAEKKKIELLADAEKYRIEVKAGADAKKINTLAKAYGVDGKKMLEYFLVVAWTGAVGPTKMNMFYSDKDGEGLTKKLEQSLLPAIISVAEKEEGEKKE